MHDGSPGQRELRLVPPADLDQERLFELIRVELGVRAEILPAGATPAIVPHQSVRVPLAGDPASVLCLSGDAVDLGAVDAAGVARVIVGLLAGQSAAVDALTADRQACVAKVRRVLDRPLGSGGLTMVFQPIVDLRSGSLVGLEALARFNGAHDPPPNRWFADAALVGFGIELEVRAIREALRALDGLPAGVYLSVNASPAAAASRELADVLRSAPLERLVLEITEHAVIADYADLNLRLRPLRDRGLRVAVDDAGSGFASWRHVLKLAPDIIKLDASLTHDIDDDAHQRALSYSLSSFAQAVGASVVAEGIETPGELAALRFLGVPYGQGRYLAAPGPLGAALVTRELNPSRSA